MTSSGWVSTMFLTDWPFKYTIIFIGSCTGPVDDWVHERIFQLFQQIKCRKHFLSLFSFRKILWLAFSPMNDCIFKRFGYPNNDHMTLLDSPTYQCENWLHTYLNSPFKPLQRKHSAFWRFHVICNEQLAFLMKTVYFGL